MHIEEQDLDALSEKLGKFSRQNPQEFLQIIGELIDDKSVELADLYELVQKKTQDKAMSYQGYSLRKFSDTFHIQDKVNPFFNHITEVSPSSDLQDQIERSFQKPLSTEKERSEKLIFPILDEWQRINHDRFTVYSGDRFDVDKEQGLNGECDFLLSLHPPKMLIEAPVFALIESKNRDIESGTGQCAAQMYAARVFNEQRGNPVSMIYGCVTNGKVWQFLRLEKETLYIDQDQYYLIELPKILGILQQIVDYYLKESL